MSATPLRPEDLVGTWRFVASTYEEPDTGKTGVNVAPGGQGYLIITPDSRFVAIIVHPGRKPGKSVEELAELQRTHLAYTGRVRLEPSPRDPNGLKLINSVELSWNEAWTGTEQIRYLALDGNRLTITTDPNPGPYTGRMQKSTIIWERSS